MLIPLALRGVRYRPQPAATMLRRNLAIYGLGGVIAPFIGIKLVDLLHHRTEVGLMRRQLLAGLRMLVILTVVLGVVYPLAVTGISQLTMSNRANGSLVRAGRRGGGLGAAGAGVRGGPSGSSPGPAPTTRPRAARRTWGRTTRT